MNKFVFVAPLLVAVAAYEKGTELLAPALPVAATSVAAPNPLAGPAGGQSTATVADVVTAANAFIATLSAAQQATLVQAYNSANVLRWSNPPTCTPTGWACA